MLEILFLGVMCYSLNMLLKGKVDNPIGFFVLMVALWFIGEITGFLAGQFVFAVLYGPGVDVRLHAYGTALFGAFLGAGSVFAVAWIMPNRRAVPGAAGVMRKIELPPGLEPAPERRSEPAEESGNPYQPPKA